MLLQSQKLKNMQDLLKLHFTQLQCAVLGVVVHLSSLMTSSVYNQ